MALYERERILKEGRGFGVEPVHARVGPEPGELAAGKLAGSNSCVFDRLRHRVWLICPGCLGFKGA